MELNEREARRNAQLAETPIKKLLVRLSVPAVISMMITNIYNIADTAFVGTLGTSQSGAAGIVFSFMTILQSVAFMCGQGAGSMMSRKLGAKEYDEATKLASTGFFLSFGLATLLGALSFVFMEPLLRLLGSTDTILPHAKVYASFIAIAAPFFSSSLTLNNILRYEGKAQLGTVGMIAGALLNIGLDALLMPGFGMGIEGAGIATAVSQVISFGILLFMFLSGRTQTKIAFRFISRSFSDFGLICATGFPSLLRQGLTSVSGMLLNQFAREYGDEAIAAMGCVSRISFFSMAVAIGIGQGFQPISAFNYGGGRYGRVREAFRTALIAEEIVLAVMSVPMFICAPMLIQLLRDDPKVIEIGTRALRLTCAAQLFIPLTMMVEMGFQSIGAKAFAIIGSAMRNGIVLIPTLIILANTRGLYGIEEAQPLSFVLSFAVGIFLSRAYLGKLKE